MKTGFGLSRYTGWVGRVRIPRSVRHTWEIDSRRLARLVPDCPDCMPVHPASPKPRRGQAVRPVPHVSLSEQLRQYSYLPIDQSYAYSDICGLLDRVYPQGSWTVSLKAEPSRYSHLISPACDRM